jgi:hypothetical protein
VLPNTTYFNSNNDEFMTSNENAVFSQPSKTNIILQDEHGNSITSIPNLSYSSQNFWSGIMSFKIDYNDPYNLVAWAYENVNSDSDRSWNGFLATCNDWDSNSTTFEGSIGQSDSSPEMWKVVDDTPQPSTEGLLERAGTWGNYNYFINNQPYFYTNTWTNATSLTCDHSLPIICVSQ